MEYIEVPSSRGVPHRFKVSQTVPKGGYVIWNIGNHMADGYVPFTLCEGYNIIPESLIAVKMHTEDVEFLRYAAGYGFISVKDCKRKLKRKDSEMGRKALALLEKVYEK